MASRRKTTVPCMVPPREAGAIDDDDDADDDDNDAVAADVSDREMEDEAGSVEDGTAPTPDGPPVSDHCRDGGAAEGGYECKYCSFQTAELNLFTVHVDAEHPDIVLNSSYVCMECDFHTKRYDALLEHNGRHHPGQGGFTRTMVRRSNQTVFQQTLGDLAVVKEEDDEAALPTAVASCRGIALSKTPIMRSRGRAEPKKFGGSLKMAAADGGSDGGTSDVIKVESEDEDEENREPPALSPAPPMAGGGGGVNGGAPRLLAAPLQVQQPGLVMGGPGLLHIKAGSGSVLPPGTLAQVLSALQNQQQQQGLGGQTQLLIPLSSIPTYNTAMDNNVLLVSAYNRFPYPSVSEIMGLSSQTKFTEEQIKVWFSAQRLKHGVSWTPEEVEEARRKKFNGTVQAVPQTITVIPAGGLQSIFQTCQIVGQPGLVLAQVGPAGGGVASPLTLAVGQARAADVAPITTTAAEASRGKGAAAATATPASTLLSPDPLGGKPKKSKEQLAELKASYGRRQFATEAEISRLMRVTGLTKRAIKKWFSDTRYNQRNAREHQGAPGGTDTSTPAPGEGDDDDEEEEDGGGGGRRSDGVTAIVIDSSDDAGGNGGGDSSSSPTASAPVPATTPPSSSSSSSSSADPRVKFRHAFPDFTPQRFKEKTPEQLLVLEASFQARPTPSDQELSRLRAETKLTRREVDAWFTERRKLPPAASPADPTAADPDGDRPASAAGAATPPHASRKLVKKTPEQLHILKRAFVRSQWPTAEEYDRMAEDSGLPRTYIVNWFGDTRYACKNSNLKWYYLYQSGKVEEALNGGPAKTQKKCRKRFRGWSRRTRRPYPCKRSSQAGGTPAIKAKTGKAFLKEHYLKHRCLEERDLDELVAKSRLSYQQVRDWFSEAARRATQGLEPFSEEEEEEDGKEGGGGGESGGGGVGRPVEEEEEEDDDEEEEEGEEEEEEEEETEETQLESEGEMEVKEQGDEAMEEDEEEKVVEEEKDQKEERLEEDKVAVDEAVSQSEPELEEGDEPVSQSEPELEDGAKAVSQSDPEVEEQT